MQKLILYHFEGCPFCHMVRDFIEDNSMEVIEKDIRMDASAREELIRIGGKTQVPCLSIDGKALYESRDIIRWLQTNWTA